MNLEQLQEVTSPAAAAARGHLLVAVEGVDSAEPARRQVRPLVERLGLAVAVRVGPSADELRAEAAASRPYLVVVHGHGPSGFRRSGDVDRDLARRGASPVLLFQAGWNPLRRLLVPLDGSPASASILPLVEDVASAYGSDVLLLRVSRRREHLEGPWPVTTDDLAESLAPARARLASAGVRVVATLGRFGDPAAEIVSCAEERGVDLVAMTRERGGVLRSWLAGSCVAYVRREFRGALLVQPST